MAAKFIEWSNNKWIVNSEYNTNLSDKNYFSADNVELDQHKHLLLNIKKNNDKDRWECAGIYSKKYYGFGTFKFEIYGKIDTLDENVVLSLFTHLPIQMVNKSSKHFHLDFGQIDDKQVNYKVDSSTVESQTSLNSEFKQSGGYTTTHIVTWDSSGIHYKSYYGKEQIESQLFASWTYKPNDKSSIPQVSSQLHINLFLKDGKAPTNNKNIIVAITDFEFTPLHKT